MDLQEVCRDEVVEADDGFPDIIEIEVDRLKAAMDNFNPIDGVTEFWCNYPVTMEMIENALEYNDFINKPIPMFEENQWNIAYNHAKRIAYLVRHGWHDAVSLDVGCPSFPGWRPFANLDDGNHRYAAALYREDKTIKISLGGEVKFMKELFGDIIDGI